MILISHRGNLIGKIPERENSPSYIDEAIQMGYDVEIDIWYMDDGSLYLGHDLPTYKIELDWLQYRNSKLWIHCKNMNALSYFNTYGKFNYFSHDVDEGVLTSYSYIWSTKQYKGGILVLPEVFNKEPIQTTIGICSDVIRNYKK